MKNLKFILLATTFIVILCSCSIVKTSEIDIFIDEPTNDESSTSSQFVENHNSIIKDTAINYTHEYLNEKYDEGDIIDENYLKQIVKNTIYNISNIIWNKGEFRDITNYENESLPYPPNGSECPKEINEDDIEMIYSGKDCDLLAFVEVDLKQIGKWIMVVPILIEDNTVIAIDPITFGPKKLYN